MSTIDISSELERFCIHLENNQRTIFSAKFGDGKTYFLNKYIAQHEYDTLFIVLHPINYSVASNEDVFEYIKRDILVELAKQPEFKEVDWEKVKKTVFDFDNILEECGKLADAIPPVKAFLIPFHLFKKVDDKYAIDKYFGRFENMKGGIFEQDQFTAAIKETIAQIQRKGKKCVLIIEDLDRIDPGHIFRILNVLGAHIDEDDKTNKFGFDNIVAVLDYYKTEHIFHHFYGAEANYSGFMAKFISHNIFEYSIIRAAQQQLMNVLQNECNLDITAINTYNFCLDGAPTGRSIIGEKIKTFSIRDIAQILDDYHAQHVQSIITMGNRRINVGSAPIVTLLSLFVRMNLHFTTNKLSQFVISTKENFQILGDAICLYSNLMGKAVLCQNNERLVLRYFVTNTISHADYGSGSFIEELSGPRLRDDIIKVLQMIYSCVRDCKPLN